MCYTAIPYVYYVCSYVRMSFYTFLRLNTITEQRRSYRASSAETIGRQAAASQTTLAASRAEDHLQDGRANVQGPEHRNTSLPLPPQL